YDLLNDPFLNKGTAFTIEERIENGLVGLLPPHVQTLEEQARQAYEHICRKDAGIEKRRFLMQLFDTNRTLFYKVFSEHVVEFMPIVYDPVIAENIEEYSELFVNPQNAVFLSVDEPSQIEESLRSGAEGKDVRLIVVSDAEEILGIGDWGTNGVDISVGKLMVYTAAAGINPEQVLPVILDCGTNRQSLLDNPLYLGNHQKRVTGHDYDVFLNTFVETAERLFPKLYLHFEDFGRDHAAALLQKYNKTYPVFNDDIQGTGIIALAGILGGLDISREKLTDQVYMCFGAGTAGCGIAHRVHAEMVEQGLSPEEAKKRFYLVDKQGLLFDDTPNLTPEQREFTRKRDEFSNAHELTNLEAAVKAVSPTILVGTSTVPGAFTEGVVRHMAKTTKRPFIFPLSNPTKLAEAKAADLIEWTEGRGLIATGIPAEPVMYKGIMYYIGQANNALIYPGLGLGVMAAEAKLLTDEMISAAAHALGGIIDVTQPGAATLPPVDKLTEFSHTVAVAVAKEAVRTGQSDLSEEEALQNVDALKWVPEYK
ncbi:MAG: NAD-dependent malic enzyme, partial [Megasphaera micronuciformis]|nr:NAD-dependent malic enzyme [Megasphaera micronuciformis]